MKIIGISPLERNTTVSLVEEGKLVAAMAEERFSRRRMHAGFPYLALQELFTRYHLTADDIDYVAYALFEACTEKRLMLQAQQAYEENIRQASLAEIFSKFRKLPKHSKHAFNIPGISDDDLRMKPSWFWATRFSFVSKFERPGKARQKRSFTRWIEAASAKYDKYEQELLEGLRAFGLVEKLVRLDHHLCHSASAYYTSGFDEALIVTLDNYGGGLSGGVAIGKDGQVERIHELHYPASLAEFQKQTTSALGFQSPWDDEKVFELAEYGDPDVLFDTVRSLFDVTDGNILHKLPHASNFLHHLATCYPKPTVAAASQKVLEVVACEYASHYQQYTGLKNLVISGDVTRNTKVNQRLFEIPGIEKIFIYPAMGGDGCGLVAELLLNDREHKMKPAALHNIYSGPEYTEAEIEDALRSEGLHPQRLTNIEAEIAELLTQGKIIARFHGRMEYSPKTLGNRSILCHANDPDIQVRLRKQLNRSELMPFAPATLYEYRGQCYQHIKGAEHTSQFRTLTFDCTDAMRKQCPAAVHIDGTACPQLVRKETNESFYRIIKEYYHRTGHSSILTANLCMHEEPLACTPLDAIRVFKLGRLNYLAMGPFFVKGAETE